MDKLFAIIKREYLIRVKSKGFIVGTILTPLLMAAVSFLPLLLFGKGSERAPFRVIVLDQSQSPTLYQELAQTLTQENNQSDRYEITQEIITPERTEARQQELNQLIKTDKLNAYLILPPDVLTTGKVFERAKNVNDFANVGRIRSALKQTILEQRLRREGISQEKIREINQDVSVEFINERGETESPMAKWGISFLLGIFLYISILVYGMYVMRGVIEEKQSRIIEVLLSSVKPFYLMLGKVAGIGLVSLTQVAIWVGSIVAITTFAAAQAIAFGDFKFPRLPISLIFFFLVFFILGYFLYATMYAMVGAIVSSEEDGQQAQLPITMCLILPYVFSSFVLTKPDSLISTILSMVPLFSPILMFMRITVQQPPWWQIALSILLLAGSVLGAIWITAKIYRVGVLMYGKRPSLPELMKWLKYT